MQRNWFFSGEKVPHSVSARVSTPFFAFLLALAAFIVALWAESLGSRTFPGLQRFLFGPRQLWDVEVTGFWILVGIWLVAAYVRLIAEADDRRRQQADLLKQQKLFLRSPHPRVVGSYLRLYQSFETAVSFAPSPDSAQELAKLTSTLRSALQIIGTFAEQYSGRTDNHYGINLMLAFSPESNTHYLPSELPDGLQPRFMDSKAKVRLRAVLWMPEELVIASVSNAGEHNQRSVPCIVLPVPEDSKPLPGAPAAYLDGGSIFPDVSKMAEYVAPFAVEVREQVLAYFAEGAEGAAIKSFASFRLGGSGGSPGVINIDSSGPNILGEDTEFIDTFRVLVKPMLVALTPLVTRFGQLRPGTQTPAPFSSDDNSNIPALAAEGSTAAVETKSAVAAAD